MGAVLRAALFALGCVAGAAVSCPAWRLESRAADLAKEAQSIARECLAEARRSALCCAVLGPDYVRDSSQRTSADRVAQ